ncbi:ELWxxDGT repeat protein [Paraconexibacter algicola]|uniref:ELWxxDGT repeat protein n=1 Tax=Paraconexibacter algicola TaxID=2133960 RepID=A0A2T4UCP2_9ACTN|nr:ELWxxDGT repeat protein [Paraconexibacter algicola]PTL54979.1 hypothetical protein C7Y72_20630 [Paraconexibacter algicola]
MSSLRRGASPTRRLAVRALAPLVALGLAAPAPSAAVTLEGPPTLLKDFRLTPPGSSDPSGFAKLGTRHVFTAGIPGGDRGIWITDGSAAGTTLVKAIGTGTAAADPTSFGTVTTPSGDVVYFAANEGTGGRELWRTDGTATGTFQLKDLASGDSNPDQFTALGDGSTFVFAAEAPNEGRELWISDGTASGTTPLPVRTGPDGSGPQDLMRIGSKVYFTADDGINGRELWRTDGTAPGTERLTDINPGPGSSDPSSPVVLNGVLYLNASDAPNNNELWKVDGLATATPTVALVKEIRQGPDGGDPRFPVVLQGKLYFHAGDETTERELWTSDGTAAGTTLVKDINPDVGASNPESLVVVGDKLFFLANDGTGVRLYVSNGTSGGTTTVTSVAYNPTPDFGQGRALLAVPNGVVFAAEGPTASGGLWFSDGTAAGTRQLDPSGAPRAAVSFGDRVYFRTSTPSTGGEPWVSDGTTAGTRLVRDLNQRTPSTFRDGVDPFLTTAGDKAYFVADTGGLGPELHVTDGTGDGTRLLRDIRPGATGSDPRPLRAVGSKLFFTANDGATGTELWVTDGTTDGTRLVADQVPGAQSPSITSSVAFDGKLYFGVVVPAVPSGSQVDLRASDGTGVSIVKSVPPAAPATFGFFPISLTVMGDALYLFGSDQTDAAAFWKLPRGASEPVKIRPIQRPTDAGPVAAGSGEMVAVGSTLFFASAGDGLDGRDTELWKSDGTAAGTVRVKDIRPGVGGSSPYELVAVGSTVFFAANDGGPEGWEIFKSDGTAAGTVRVTDIPTPTAGTFPGSLTVVGDRLVFLIRTPTAGIEPWVTDGTAAGTSLLADTAPGTTDGGVTGLRVIRDRLHFGARTAAVGEELWTSDGTPASTTPTDIRPGSESSTPRGFAQAGDRVVLVATQDIPGRELFTVPARVPPAPPAPPTPPTDPGSGTGTGTGSPPAGGGGTTPGGGTTTPPRTAFAFGGPSTLRLDARNRAAVALRCTGTTVCAGTVTLTVRATQRVKGKRRTVRVTVARAAFRAAAGGTVSVRLTLNAQGRKLVRAGRTTAVTATATIGRTSVTRTLKLRRPAAKRR